MAKIKSFVAIKLPNQQKRKIRNVLNRFSHVPNLNLIETEGLHITLNFVGNVDDVEVPTLCKRIANASEEFLDFPVQLSGFGGFPSLEKPRVFWIGVDKGSDTLIELNASFRSEIEDLGFLQEQRYTPHLTIARTKQKPISQNEKEDLKTAIERLEFDEFNVEEIVVFSSVAEKNGPVYVPLSTIRLK